MQHRVAERAGARLSRRLLKGYFAMPYTFHLQRNSWELIRNAYDTVQLFVGEALVPAVKLISQSFIIVGLLVVLLVTSPIATLLAAGVLGPFTWLLLRAVLQRVKRLGTRAAPGTQEPAVAAAESRRLAGHHAARPPARLHPPVRRGSGPLCPRSLPQVDREGAAPGRSGDRLGAVHSRVPRRQRADERWSPRRCPSSGCSGTRRCACSRPSTRRSPRSTLSSSSGRASTCSTRISSCSARTVQEGRATTEGCCGCAPSYAWKACISATPRPAARPWPRSTSPSAPANPWGSWVRPAAANPRSST